VISRDQNLLAISCSGLVKHYPRVIAVDGIDLQVKSGECFGLLGPNGAGKTTTVEILEGLTRPDGGIVELFGKRWGSGRDHELRKELGIQLQESQLPPKLTVFEADARFEKLSGGQKQRLSLATALVGNPRILFLDEPTTGLDPQARLKIWEIIEGFKTEGGTTLLTTHYMEEAARLCDRVAIIDHGKVIAVDRPTELVAAMNADQIVEFRTRPALTTGQESEICALSGVGSLACHEGALVLSVSRIGATLPTLLAALDQHGLEVLELKTHQPTLEDVFVSLTGRALRDD
jgi:ABC-2 type transport system ATP-binding protein